MKKAFITGITGQDGSYLTAFLLGKGYEVHGLQRRSSSPNTERIDHIKKNITFDPSTLMLHQGDVTDGVRIMQLINAIQPHEIYHLAGQSDVGVSFHMPAYTAQVNAIGTLHMLEAMRALPRGHTKFYQASSSELFGKTNTRFQSESTPFYPRSPYAISKLYAYWAVVNYREAYSLFACNGILFNHESPVRGEQFVTRKITRAVAARATGTTTVLRLGNLDASRDWGYAGDYVRAMWLMLQHEHAEDFVIATGESHTVREFVEEAFAYINIQVHWQGKGLQEKAIDRVHGTVLVEIDENLFRPTEVDHLLGDASLAANKLGWRPTVHFKDLVHLMMREELTNIEHRQTNCPLSFPQPRLSETDHGMSC